jgi:hypothetical protein
MHFVFLLVRVRIHSRHAEDVYTFMFPNSPECTFARMGPGRTSAAASGELTEIGIPDGYEINSQVPLCTNDIRVNS